MRRVHYAWIVAAVGFVTLITTAGFRSTSGVLIVPLQEEFGWSRALLGFAVFVNLMLFGLCGPFAAALAERYGLKRVMIGALAAVSIGSSLTVFMSAPWQLVLLWGVVNGFATGAISVPLAALIANRWFVRRRGLVTGILTASNATGQLIFLPALAWIVQSHGWRYAAVTVAVVAVAIVLPLVALLMRDRPDDLGLVPYGADVADPPAAGGNPFRGAVQGLLDARHSNTF
jgi:sugar phosphate permease